MNFTDAELEEIYNVVYEDVYYGEDGDVYGDHPAVVARRVALEKITDEMKKRKLL